MIFIVLVKSELFMYAPMGHIWDIYIYFSVLELKLITHFFLNIQGESKKTWNNIFVGSDFFGIKHCK